MGLGEFELIERYFRQPAEARRRQRGDVPLGIGDDAAVLDVPPGHQLVAALDTLVEGRHFPPGVPPESIGHRALAVNLSDLAAMGAEPAWFLLSLTLPAAEAQFLERFARGLFALAERYQVALVGGDTTGGPQVVVAVQAMGTVAAGSALTRAGARPGDVLYVSGTPGDSAGGLKLLLDPAAGAGLDAMQRQWLIDRFLYPAPRLELGRALVGLASACIDVSDGLAADAGRLASASGCALAIDTDLLPLSPALVALAGVQGARQLALSGGEDYELCFAVPPQREAELRARLDNVKCMVQRIGNLGEGSGTTLREQGRPVTMDITGFDHFAGR